MQAYLLNRSRTDVPWNICLPKFRNASADPPHVTATLGFCKSNCGSGPALNSRLEWLAPLSTWVFPMLVLLAQLPVGDLPQRFIDRYRVLDYVKIVWPYIEWVSVLGDPASAFVAAYSTLAKDFILSYSFLAKRTGKQEGELTPLDRSLMGLAMVASRTRPEEYPLAAFLPVLLSREISDHLMNPSVQGIINPKLRDQLYALKLILENGSLRLALYPNDAREILNSFGENDTTEKDSQTTLQEKLKNLERALTDIKTLSPVPVGVVGDEKHPEAPVTNSDDGDYIAADLLSAVSAVNLLWATNGVSTSSEREELQDIKTAPSPPVQPTSSYTEERKVLKDILHPSTAIKLIIQAIGRSRSNFLLSFAFPMIIVFTTIINTFNTAYKELGDQNTAQGIAYGTWYMWILILTVASNSAASALETSIVQDALRTTIGIRPRQIFVESVMSRNIFGNNANWFRWLETAGVPKTARIGILGPQDHEHRFHFIWHIVWQVLGWVWVGFACANAAAVSFTTPTVGLGCRSFNQVLYGGGTFIAAILRVFKSDTFERVDANPVPASQQRSREMPTWRKHAGAVVGMLYHTVCTLNVLILVVGTFLQISGFYNTCKCQALFGDDNTVIDISSPTKGRENARRYWLSMAWVAYGTAWGACGLAICARQFIFGLLEQEFKEED
ncbi:hypothetical protein TWF730_001634 [Orbilia blumenaviensis]|uniref:Uncharacterized protein n=1 Tax=Orbilia blumenaviensis TaxID=1796055 RepID=A0AAV9UI96_9PEZI